MIGKLKTRCEVVPVSPVLLALTQEEVRRSQISTRIRAMFDIVYTWLRNAPVRQAGHNYALYDQCSPQTLRMRVGVPVSGRFLDTDLVQCVELAPGRAARAVHVGSYSDLHETYAVLNAWCSQNALELTGESWEVYGDWTEDVSRLETGLFLRVQDA